MFKYMLFAVEQFHTFCQYYQLFIDCIAAEKKKGKVKDRKYLKWAI